MMSTVSPSKTGFGGRRATPALIQQTGQTVSGLYRLFVCFVLISLSHFVANHANLEFNGEEISSQPPSPTELVGSSGPIPRTQPIFEARDQVIQSPFEESLPSEGKILIRRGRYLDQELCRGNPSWPLAKEVEFRQGNAIIQTACA